jgi:carboxymethylenebutenolidase
VPVLSHFGDQDHWITLDSVEAFRKAHAEVEVHVYHANHGFNCDQRGSHDAPSAQLARERSLAFFARHLA